MTLTLTFARSFGSLAHALREATLTTIRAVQTALEVRRNRRAVLNLAHFDDRMLHDIGLSRSEVMGALEAPLHRDPSALLTRGPAPGRGSQSAVRCNAPAMTARATLHQGFAQGIA